MYYEQEHLTSEENIIYSLVDEIYNYEKKINEIQQTQNELITDKNENFQEIKLLEQKQNELQNKLSQISSNILNYISNNDNQIKLKQISINNLNDKITEIKNKLNQYNTIYFKNTLLTKYILMNNSYDYLSDKQIDDILNNEKKKFKWNRY